jgi:hypothetical protein
MRYTYARTGSRNVYGGDPAAVVLSRLVTSVSWTAPIRQTGRNKKRLTLNWHRVGRYFYYEEHARRFYNFLAKKRSERQPKIDEFFSGTAEAQGFTKEGLPTQILL